MRTVQKTALVNLSEDVNAFETVFLRIWASQVVELLWRIFVFEAVISQGTPRTHASNPNWAHSEYHLFGLSMEFHAKLVTNPVPSAAQLFSMAPFLVFAQSRSGVQDSSYMISLPPDPSSRKWNPCHVGIHRTMDNHTFDVFGRWFLWPFLKAKWPLKISNTGEAAGELSTRPWLEVSSSR